MAVITWGVAGWIVISSLFWDITDCWAVAAVCRDVGVNVGVRDITWVCYGILWPAAVCVAFVFNVHFIV